MKMHVLALAVALSSTFALNAQAAPPSEHGIINFTGSIVDSPCSISPDTADQTVDLGTVGVSQLTGGGKSTPKEFHIKLENCDTTKLPATVTTKFSGHAYANDTSSLAGLIGLDSGDARGAAIGLTDDSGKQILVNTESDKQILTLADNTLVYYAYLQGSAEADVVINPGDFNTAVNFEIAYQ